MNTISSDNLSHSLEAVNQILQTAQTENLELAKKMLIMQKEIVLASETGKGALLDIIA